MTEIQGTETIFVRVSARFELARVRVIGSRLPVFYFMMGKYLMVGLSDHNCFSQDYPHWAGIQYSIDFITQRVEWRKLLNYHMSAGFCH